MKGSYRNIPLIFPDTDPLPIPVEVHPLAQANDEVVIPAPNPDTSEAVEGEQEQGNIDCSMILSSTISIFP